MKKGYFESSITALPKVLCIKAKKNRPSILWGLAYCVLREKKLNECSTLCTHACVLSHFHGDYVEQYWYNTGFSYPPPDISRFARLTWTYAHINTLTHPGWSKTNAVMVVVLEVDSIYDRTSYIMLFFFFILWLSWLVLENFKTLKMCLLGAKFLSGHKDPERAERSYINGIKFWHRVSLIKSCRKRKIFH